MPQLNGNVFTSRVPMQFWSQDNPALSIVGANSLVNNPNIFYVQPGNVGQIDIGINGASFWRGSIEVAPFVIECTWDMIGYNDYLALAQLNGYYVDMISFRNIGYYGRMMMDGPRSDKQRQSDVVSTKASLYVLTPSDYGGAQAVTRVSPPNTVSVSTQPGGALAQNSTMYYWLTFSTILGETTPYFTGAVTNSNAGGVNNLSWLWPTSAYCTGATLYVGASNDPTQSKVICEAINGDMPTWSDYVGFNGAIIDQQPPTTNTAYAGQWMGGIWQNDPASS